MLRESSKLLPQPSLLIFKDLSFDYKYFQATSSAWTIEDRQKAARGLG